MQKQDLAVGVREAAVGWCRMQVLMKVW